MYTTFAEPASSISMLYAIFQDFLTSGSEIVLKDSIYMGVAAILIVTWTNYTNFRSPFQLVLTLKFGLERPSGMAEDL